MLLEVQNQQIYYALHVIVILLSDGQDFSNHGYDQLIPMIRNSHVKVIIGEYTTIGETNDPLLQLAHLQNALPEQVVIVKDLTYQQVYQYCNFYEHHRVNILFAISNLMSMKGHIYQVSNLFGLLISTFVIKKLYFINNLLQDSGYYENFITLGERDNLILETRKRQKLMLLVFLGMVIVMSLVFVIIVTSR
ncbi:hypothetical protein pb186bvf_007935 [Paramecium bursaria]